MCKCTQMIECEKAKALYRKAEIACDRGDAAAEGRYYTTYVQHRQAALRCLIAQGGTAVYGRGDSLESVGC